MLGEEGKPRGEFCDFLFYGALEARLLFIEPGAVVAKVLDINVRSCLLADAFKNIKYADTFNKHDSNCSVYVLAKSISINMLNIRTLILVKIVVEMQGRPTCLLSKRSSQRGLAASVDSVYCDHSAS